MSELEYGAPYATYLTSAGITPPSNPINLRGVIKAICGALGTGTTPSNPGATAPARFAGGTTGGAPVSGTFAVGDFVVDETGGFWVNTIAGSPGTWVFVGSGQELGYFSSTSTLSGLTSTAYAPVTGYTKTITVPATGRPIYIDCFATINVTTAVGVVLDITEDGTSVSAGDGLWTYTFAVNAFNSPRFRVRRTPSAGSHTYAVVYKLLSASSLTFAFAGEPYDMSITQA